VVRWGGARWAWLGVALTVVWLAACGGGRGSTLGPERHLEIAAGAQGRASTPVAAAAGPLAPGEYYTSLFEPTFTYTVGDGWALQAETEGVVVLRRPVGDQPEGLLVFVLSPARADAVVLDDPICTTEACKDAARDRSMPFPDEYFAYLAQQQEVTASDVGPATLLGREGSVADVAVTDRPDGLPCAATTSCIALLVERQPVTTPHGFLAGDRERVWDVGTGNDRLIVMARVAAAVADSFDLLVQDALGVLTTINFA
jgi:hypothetical protein